MRWIASVLLPLATAVHADRIRSQAELVGLPSYCRGTQQVRDISHDPTPIRTYMAKYGGIYYHLHHYCWALNSENKASRIMNRSLARSKLGYAIGDIDYVLNHDPDPKFIFLPEIYTTKARILLKLDRPEDAVVWLKKAIAANPRYVPAYARLSDYYMRKSKITEARKILEQGIRKSKNSSMLKQRLKRLQTGIRRSAE